MATQFERFKGALADMFMLDHADLDFGIYRIMNQKRNDIEKYLNNDLKRQVTEAVSGYSSAEVQSLKSELAKAIQNAQDLGVDPKTSPKVKELRAKLSEGGDTEGLENEVYSHLTTFFSRYYDGGDFISQRRYKKDVYAIPYEGEELKLHWANADQYYIKTGEYFRSYRFTLTDGKAVEFTLRKATVEQNNNLAQNNMERRFALYDEQPVEVDGDTLHINFTYELYPKAKKQNDFIVKAYDTVKDMIPSDFAGVFEPKPTEKDRSRTLLLKHLNDYVARNTFDYFIHKDLNGFLSRELDFFIKNEILVIDDIDAQNPKDFVQHLSVIKAIKTVGKKIITFLASLEDFQKKLWLKKKFVVQADYCITLDRVPEELYPEICANDKQREEWVKLFAIDEIKKDGMFGVDYTIPLTVDFLKANPFLVLDTAFFSSDFKKELLPEIDNIDEQCDGLLINSENAQALELLQTSSKIKCIYIDPPYNTGNDGFTYKDRYQHSSWLAMMNDRLRMAHNLMADDAVIFISIDDKEVANLKELCDCVFGNDNFVAQLIWERAYSPKNDAKYVSNSHDYVLMYARNIEAFKIGRLPRTEDANARYSNPDNDPRGPWKSSDISVKTYTASCDYPITTPSGRVIEPPAGRCWRLSPKAFGERLQDNRIWFGPNGDNTPSMKRFLSELKYEGMAPTSILFYKEVGHSQEGAQELTRDMFNKGVFSGPKPVRLLNRLCILANMQADNNDIALDFFAGSGTTGHAVINLNREDGGHRKFILCEMGDYFNTVTKPRIQKVIYSKDWNNGKPVSREGSSHCFKYMRLEQYEDTLNNLVVKSSMTADSGAFYDGYMLGYLLDTETKDSLFNLEWFRNPWNTKLFITRQNETKEENIDLIETFNYLIGLNVKTILYPKEGICTVEGVTRSGEHTLVIWRNVDMIDNEALNKFFKKQEYSTKDSEFDRIYVNGDCNLENLRTDEESWKVVLTEKEFAKRMFEDC